MFLAQTVQAPGAEGARTVVCFGQLFAAVQPLHGVGCRESGQVLFVQILGVRDVTKQRFREWK